MNVYHIMCFNMVKRKKVIAATWISPDEKELWNTHREKDKVDWVTWIKDKVNQSLDTDDRCVLTVYADDAVFTEWDNIRRSEALDEPVASWTDWITEKVRMGVLVIDTVRSVSTVEVTAIKDDVTELENSNRELVTKNRSLQDEISFLKKHQLSVTDGIVLDMLADGRKRTFNYLLQEFVQYQGDALYSTLEALADRGLVKVDGTRWSVV